MATSPPPPVSYLRGFSVQISPECPLAVRKSNKWIRLICHVSDYSVSELYRVEGEEAVVVLVERRRQEAHLEKQEERAMETERDREDRDIEGGVDPP